MITNIWHIAWCNHIILHGTEKDGYTPNLVIDSIEYSFAKTAKEDLYGVPVYRADSGWKHVEEAFAKHLCITHCTPEEITKAQLQYELSR